EPKDERAKYPRNRVQFHLAQSLLSQSAWEECVPEARKLLGDKVYGLQARRMLARAYLGNNQADKALDTLGELQGTAEWNQEAMTWMAQALLATNRPQEALKHIEQAVQKQADDVDLMLLHGKVLNLLSRTDEALVLYQKVLKVRPRSSQAQMGIGDLEVQL